RRLCGGRRALAPALVRVRPDRPGRRPARDRIAAVPVAGGDEGGTLMGVVQRGSRVTRRAVSMVVAATALVVLGPGTTTVSIAQPSLPFVCDGRWRVVPSPNPGTSDVLTAVSSDGAGGEWAVGDSGKGQQSAHTLIERWDGLAWSTVPSPSPGISGN